MSAVDGSKKKTRHRSYIFSSFLLKNASVVSEINKKLFDWLRLDASSQNGHFKPARNESIKTALTHPEQNTQVKLPQERDIIIIINIIQKQKYFSFSDTGL